jgi:hypothetical protein
LEENDDAPLGKAMRKPSQTLKFLLYVIGGVLTLGSFLSVSCGMSAARSAPGTFTTVMQWVAYFAFPVGGIVGAFAFFFFEREK